MVYRKPDLLLILTLVLGIGILFSSYGGMLLDKIDLQVLPVVLAKGLK